MTKDLSMTGAGKLIEGDLSALQEIANAHWSAELARIKEISLITGGEVIYDLAMFGEEWSPAFHHGHDDPVAWVNGRTGERIDGPERPVG